MLKLTVEKPYMFFVAQLHSREQIGKSLLNSALPEQINKYQIDIQCLV